MNNMVKQMERKKQIVIQKRDRNNKWIDVKRFNEDQGFEAEKKFNELSNDSSKKMRMIERKVIQTNY